MNDALSWMLAFVVLLYTILHGFGTCDILPQTHSEDYDYKHGKACPDKMSTIMSDGGMKEIERIIECPKDKDTTRHIQKSFGIGGIDMHDDEEEPAVEIKDVDEVKNTEGSMRYSDRNRNTIEKDVEEKTFKTETSDQSVKNREKRTETRKETRKHTDSSLTLCELNNAILHVPTFVPNFTNVKNPECQQHGKIFLQQLKNYKLWALQMLDSSAKIPSGLLQGNLNQLGDYDQCLGVLEHVKVNKQTIRIQGKYCLATIDLHAFHQEMKLPVNLMEAGAVVRSTMHDPSHFAPRFTTINWALCLPAACSAKDAKNALKNALASYNTTIGIKFEANVNPNMCYVKQKSQNYSKGTIGVLYFYAIIICLVIIATVWDNFEETQEKGNYFKRIVMSFSLRRTIKALLKEANATDITCIHGIRVLTMLIAYVCHLAITMTGIPYSNRISCTDSSSRPWTSFLRVWIVHTDTFLLISGLLTAYTMATEMNRDGEIRWFKRFIARYIRFTPALLAVILWYAFVMEHIGSGPQWNSIIMPNAELCKSNAWTNLLYVQNFFPFEEMCIIQTHHLALDMQFSITAPILVFLLQYKPLIGTLLMAFLVLLSATLRYIATMNNSLSIIAYHGMTIKRLFKTFNLFYGLPLHRATPYIFGVGLGVLLCHTGKNVRIHKLLIILGWLMAMSLGLWTLFSPWRLTMPDYVYNAEEISQYAVIVPILWSAALCWLIFACFTKHGGFINRFLSSYWLAIFSRISYALFLTQFAVLFYNVGTTRYATEFRFLTALINPLEIGILIFASVVVTLLFDLPMQEVKSIIMKRTDKPALDASKET